MSINHVLRIESVHFDYLRSCLVGTAVCTDPNGTILRRHVEIVADPFWPHDVASAALLATARDLL